MAILRDLNTLSGAAEVNDRIARMADSEEYSVTVGSGDFGDSVQRGQALAEGRDGRGAAEANLGRSADVRVTYDTVSDEDGGTNTFVTLSRYLAGEAYDIANGSGTVDNGHSSRGTSVVLNDGDNPPIGVKLENGGISGCGMRCWDAIRMDNLARELAGMPQRPAPASDGNLDLLGPGLTNPTESGGDEFKNDRVQVNATDRNRRKPN